MILKKTNPQAIQMTSVYENGSWVIRYVKIPSLSKVTTVIESLCNTLTLGQMDNTNLCQIS